MENFTQFGNTTFEATSTTSSTSFVFYVIATIGICFTLVVIFGIVEIARNIRKTRKNTEITNKLLIEILNKNNETNF